MNVGLESETFLVKNVKMNGQQSVFGIINVEVSYGTFDKVFKSRVFGFY